MGVCKTLKVTPEYVLHNMTYQNVLLYTSAVPVFEKDDTKEGKNNGGEQGFDDSLDADNPENFNDLPDDEIITSLH